MRILALLLSVFIFYSCLKEEEKINLPEVYLLKTSDKLTNKNGVFFLGNQKYTGHLFLLAQNQKDTLLLENYYNGLLEGTQKKWFENRQIMEVRNYKQGIKNGYQVAFWENGNKQFEYTAKNDAYEGEMKEWTQDGQLFHLATYKDGQEDGTQKMWYSNGKIRANYVIIKGKRFGLLGTKNCKNVSDSVFVIK